MGEGLIGIIDSINFELLVLGAIAYFYFKLKEK
jgi:hypothetical protein